MAAAEGDRNDGVLLLSVQAPGGDLNTVVVRILAADPSRSVRVLGVVVGLDALLDTVRHWLLDVVGDADATRRRTD